MLVLAAGAGFPNTHASTAQAVANVADRLYHAHVYGQVHVTFEDGIATLTGTVDSLRAKFDAERAARKVEDVVQVVDHIDVRTEDITARQILEGARKAIVTYYAYTIFDNVVLQAQGNSLVVSGQVTDPYKREDIGNFLARIKGIAEFKNNLKVLPVSNYDDQLRIAIARAIYNDPYFVHYATQALPPIHVIVKNGNVTLEGAVATQVDRAKAESEARFAGTFFALVNNLRVESK